MIKYLVLISGLFFSTKSYTQDSSSILYWSGIDQLEWVDFRGKTNSEFSVTQNNYSAVSSLNIEFLKVDTVNNLDCYRLRSSFYCLESWNNVESINLLAHERYHFNLIELTTRKLRKKLNELMTLKRRIDFYNELETQFDKYDSIVSLYDNETRHGTKGIQQLNWEKKIRKELFELKDFSDDMIFCSCSTSN